MYSNYTVSTNRARMFNPWPYHLDPDATWVPFGNSWENPSEPPQRYHDSYTRWQHEDRRRRRDEWNRDTWRQSRHRQRRVAKRIRGEF